MIHQTKNEIVQLAGCEGDRRVARAIYCESANIRIHQSGENFSFQIGDGPVCGLYEYGLDCYREALYAVLLRNLGKAKKNGEARMVSLYVRGQRMASWTAADVDLAKRIARHQKDRVCAASDLVALRYEDMSELDVKYGCKMMLHPALPPLFSARISYAA